MSLSQITIGAYLDELASDSPAPGGGSAAALMGALGAALCAMAARLTLGKEKYREAWERMEETLREAEQARARFLELAEEDTRVFLSYMEARRLPKANDEQRRQREKAVREAALRCAQVPLQTLKAIRPVCELAAFAVEHGNPSCMTDAGAAAVALKAGALTAAYNVRTNLPSISDAGERDSLVGETQAVLGKITQTVFGVERMLDERLGHPRGA